MAKTDQDNKASKANKKTLNDNIVFDADIRKEDILCGQEKHCVSHPGSLNFRAVIDQYASKYQEAITKQEKMNVTKEIYDNLGSQNTRFLKFNAAVKGWEELSSLLARDKISHALRFANREKKSPSTSKPRAKKGHRRTGSDSSTSTLTTVATELSQEDFDLLLDDEPLDWSAEDMKEEESKPYAYPVYETAPPAYHQSYSHPPPPAYPHYPHPHHAYGHGYYHPQSYHHHPHAYHHAPQHHYAPAQPQPSFEVEMPMDFPEMPASEPPARKSSMDVDLSYLVSEPLMDWDLEPEQVCMVDDQ